MDKKIYLLWLQGWDKAPWLQKKVLESWQINNPLWSIELLDFKNLKNYVDDIDYIYDFSKKISPQAKSDIIRLSILKNHGGIWADSTLLCMQPLDHWAFQAVEKTGIWMYHGHGAFLNSDLGPASWFILSEKNGYLVSRWKESCDDYWKKNNYAFEYFWMDELFKKLLDQDQKFKSKWLNTPYLYCEDIGSAHTLSDYNYGIEGNNKYLKNLLRSKPPYVLKLSSDWENIFPTIYSKKFIDSNVNFAILMSKRKYIFKHNYEIPSSKKFPKKRKPYLLRQLKVLAKRILYLIGGFKNK